MPALLGTLLWAAALSCLHVQAQTQPVADAPRDLVFFYIDDMRPETGFMKDPLAYSPNMDAIAAEGTVFERAYTQLAVCAPSRTALLTSRRPDTNKVWSISTEEYWREVKGGTNATTLPQMLKEAGYITIGQGKVFHPGAPNGDDDSAYSWSPEGLPYYHSPIEGEYGPGNKTAIVWPFEGFADDDLPDGQIAAHAVANVQALKANRSAGDTRPFALFVGFHKPHTPILFPAKYWNMTSDNTLPKHPGAPIGAPPISINAWGNLHEYDDIAPLFPDKVLEEQCTTNASVGLVDPRCRMPDNMTMHIRHGYRAAIAYTDAQIGRVMAELKGQDLWEDSAVFLTSDHGWSLGEGQAWAKFEVTEKATSVAMLAKVPGYKAGQRVSRLVEQVDVFPSVAEAVGVTPVKRCPIIEDGGRDVQLCTEGTSFLVLMHKSNETDEDVIVRQQEESIWKAMAFQQYPRPNSGYKILGGDWPAWSPEEPHHNSEAAMGYAIRTDTWRYVEWVGFNATRGKPLRDINYGVELYNYTDVPIPLANYDYANVNLAGEPEYAELIQNLSRSLWKTMHNITE